MSKIAKSLTEQKESYAVSLFKEDPTLSIPKANGMMKDRFGSILREVRLYELRKTSIKLYYPHLLEE